MRRSSALSVSDRPVTWLPVQHSVPGCPRLWCIHCSRCFYTPVFSPHFLSPPSEGCLGSFQLQMTRSSAPALARLGLGVCWASLWPLTKSLPSGLQQLGRVTPAGSARVLRVWLRVERSALTRSCTALGSRLLICSLATSFSRRTAGVNLRPFPTVGGLSFYN